MKRYISLKETKNTGSYLDNIQLPKEGQIVYFLKGQIAAKPIKGKIVTITNIDKKGLSNTYLDIEVNSRIYHTNISQVFDHLPKYQELSDEYGSYKKWI
jgi:hypothetical protein